MVRTRKQAAEGPIPPSPPPTITKRSTNKKKNKQTRQRTEIVELTPAAQHAGPDLNSLLIQQQLAQQLTTLAQALSQQAVINPTAAPAQPSTSRSVTYAQNAHPPATKHIPAPKLSGPEGMNIIQFRDWKQRWNDFATTQQIQQFSIDAQHGILRAALHAEWTMLWNSSRLKIPKDCPLQDCLNCMEAYLRRKRNPILDRQEFHRRDQMSGESVDRYYSALRELDDACGHEDELKCNNCQVQPAVIDNTCTCGTPFDLNEKLQDIRLRDRFICGLRDREMQRKVLTEQYESVLTMEKVLLICTAVENSNTAGIELGYTGGSNHHLQVVSTYRKQHKNPLPPSNQGRSRSFQQTRISKHVCIWCGGKRHDRDLCPARNQTCTNCRKVGHLDAVCMQKRWNVNNIAPNMEDTNEEDINRQHGIPTMRNVTIFRAGKNENLLQIPTEIAELTHHVNWLPDTGADVDAISVQDIVAIGSTALSKMTPEKQEVFAANGSSLVPVGSVDATLHFNNKSYDTSIRVFQTLTTPLLSKNGCIALGLIDANWPNSKIETSTNQISTAKVKKYVTGLPAAPQTDSIKQDILKDLAAAFDDSVLRPMNGPPMKIELVAGAKPCKRYKAHTIPFHWRDQVKAQLDDMVKKGIVEPVPVGEAIDWCHPMVVVPKKGTSEPRITVDLTGINPYVRRPVYPVKIPRETVARIPPGNRYFTTLDARHGYWQVPLDEESKKLTTFITPWGCFRYLRNVMGLISAGDEHNRRGDEAIKGISNTEKIVEDILIYDEDFKTHVQRVKDIIKRCEQHCITLNARKFVFAQSEVDWCGFRISKDGYTPAPHLVQALVQFPVPVSKTDVRSFCGLVQQFEAFSSRISELALPIRALLPKSAAFLWESLHQKAFTDIIAELSSPRILAQFNPTRPVRLETDGAQSKGLGFALWQQQEDNTWKLLQAGSRFVTPAEARYSATEIEMLAVVWAVKKCRMFLLGSPFELIVDHRPLTSIINSKTLDEIENPRLQRFKEKLACFRPQVIWRAGKQHIVVDVFSRYPSSHPTPDDEADDDKTPAFAFVLHDNEDGTAILKDPILISIREAGNICSEYGRLKSYIKTGFPKFKESLDEDLRPYWKLKDDLVVENELIVWGARILIPIVLRCHVLDTLHASHQGQERTLRRARQTIFWPNVTNDIRNIVRGCHECASRLPSQQKEPYIVERPSNRPFECVGVDLFKHAGYEYLVMVDQYSGWITVAKCGRSATTGDVIRHLKQWMMGLGIPEKLISDNGPQFSSIEFKNWTKKWGIHHDPSSPYYPQANGLAESGVKAVSALLSKTSPNGDLNSDLFQLGLLEFRNTPRADGRSPAQLVFGGPLRSQLPLHRSRFMAQWRQRSAQEDDRAKRLKEKAVQQYNNNSRPLSRLRCGDIVRMQDPHTKLWNRIAEVIDVHSRGRSYTLRSESGGTYWRNRRFLRRYYVTFQPSAQETKPGNGSEVRPQRSRRPPQRLVYGLQHDQRSSSERGACGRRIVLPLVEPGLDGKHQSYTSWGMQYHEG